jgi:hypothetical protein
LQRGLPRRFADVLDHDVGSVALGRLLHRRPHVATQVVHDGVRARFLGLRELLVAGRGCDHTPTEGFRENERRGGDAAADSPDEHPLALLEPGTRDEHPVGGLEDEREGRCLLEGELGGKRVHVVRRYGDELGVRPVHVLADDVRAVLEAGVDDDLVSGRESVGALPDHLYDSRAVGPEDARLGRGGETLARPDVQMVERGRP